jgi:hypothetical protein
LLEYPYYPWYCNDLSMMLFLLNFQMKGMDGVGAVVGNCGVGEGMMVVLVMGGGTPTLIMTPPIIVLFVINACLGPVCTFICFVTLDSWINCLTSSLRERNSQFPLRTVRFAQSLHTVVNSTAICITRKSLYLRYSIRYLVQTNTHLYVCSFQLSVNVDCSKLNEVVRALVTLIRIFSMYPRSRSECWRAAEKKINGSGSIKC